MKKLLIILLACLGLTACNGNVIEPKGISRTYVNEAGYLVVVYNDGTEDIAGYVKGEQGEQGEPGKDGKDGEDGKDGADGKDGQDGKDGIDGKDGKDGKDGEVIYITTSEENPADTSEPEETVEQELYNFKFYAGDLANEAKAYEIKNYFEIGSTVANHPATNRSVFKGGELITKPGYIIKEVLVACPDRMANVYFLDDEYNNVNPNFNNQLASCISLKVENLNIENLHIVFTTYDAGLHDYYGPSEIRINYSINEETYTAPAPYIVPDGYAGLQVYNNNNQTNEYKVGKIGDTITSKELEDYILSLHPGYEIYAKNYSSFTTTYQETKFTTRKVYIRKVA